MGKHVEKIVTYTCDYCGTTVDKENLINQVTERYPNKVVSVTTIAYYQQAIMRQDICRSCNDKLGSFLKDLREGLA